MFSYRKEKPTNNHHYQTWKPQQFNVRCLITSEHTTHHHHHEETTFIIREKVMQTHYRTTSCVCDFKKEKGLKFLLILSVRCLCLMMMSLFKIPSCHQTRNDILQTYTKGWSIVIVHITFESSSLPSYFIFIKIQTFTHILMIFALNFCERLFEKKKRGWSHFDGLKINLFSQGY